MHDTKLGTYWPLDSFWHRRDPRTLMATTFALLGISLYFSDLIGQVLILLIIVFIYLTALLPLKTFDTNIRPFKWILLLIFFANLLWPYGLKTMNNSRILNQISSASFLTLRFMNMILISLWLTMTVRVTTLINIIALAMQPLNRYIPVNEILLAMGVAIRFFTILQEESEEIILAQRARSNGQASRGLKEVVLLIPLLVGALRRAQVMASAIECRGYKEGQAASIWPEIQWSIKETIILTSILTFILAIVFIYRCYN